VLQVRRWSGHIWWTGGITGAPCWCLWPAGGKRTWCLGNSSPVVATAADPFPAIIGAPSYIPHCENSPHLSTLISSTQNQVLSEAFGGGLGIWVSAMLPPHSSSASSVWSAEIGGRKHVDRGIDLNDCN
jgi:hypothetical protein